MRSAARSDFVGGARLVPGNGFALRTGIWSWALSVATERSGRPVGLAVRRGPELRSAWHCVDGARVHARVGGAGSTSATAVVLLHGVIVSSRYLMPIGVELARDRPVLIPDLPGFGLSDPPPGPPRLYALADAAMALAQSAGHERVAIVANSFGAQVGVEAAVRHPARVERVVLLGPTVDADARTLLTQALRWMRNAPDEHLSVLPVMARDLADLGLARAARLLRVMLRDQIEGKLPAVRCPALVVRGGRDRVVPAAWAERLAETLPRGRLVVLPGYAHMAHYSGPLALAPILRDFLSGDRASLVRPRI